MLSRLLALACCLFVIPVNAAEYAWTFQAGGQTHDKARAMAVDSRGGIYITGEFSGAARFGDREVLAHGNMDFFLAKLSSKGKLKWVSTFGGEKIERGYSVAVDREGNSFVTGHFQSDQVKIGSTTLKNNGDYDIFIAKYDSTGSPLWATSGGGEAYDFGHGIALDRSGHLYVSGAIRTAGTFRDGEEYTPNLAGPFIAKYSVNGELIWTRLMVGRGSGSAHEIAVDQEGSIYAGGFLAGKVQLAGHDFQASKGRDIFAVKMTPAGNIVWKFQAGGQSDGLVSAIAADAKGNCYLAGMFKNVAQFGDQTFTAGGDNDFYVSKLDPKGKPLWTHKAGGEKTDYALGMALDRKGNCVITGETTGDVNLAGANLRAIGRRDIYTAKFGPAGELLWAKQAGGTLNSLGYAVGCSRDGLTSFAGAFSGEITVANRTLVSHGSNDIIVGAILD